MSNKKDLRSRRTERAIYAAFFHLLYKKDYKDITIQDISEEALINRSTFYAHFQDKDRLLEKIIEKRIEDIRSIISFSLMNERNEIKLNHIQNLLNRLLTEIKAEKELYRLIISIIDNHIITEKFRKLIVDEYEDVLSQLKIMESDMEVPVDLIIDYSISIFFVTINWWLNEDCAHPVKQLSTLIIKLVGNANLTVLGIKII